MRAGTTTDGQNWSVRRRILAWRPTTDLKGLGVEQVHWMDQRIPTPTPEPAHTADEEQSPKRSGNLLDLPDDLTAMVLLPVVLGATWLISAIVAVLLTPPLVLARATGLGRWCLDVRLNGVLVDKRYGGRAADLRRIADITADELTQSRFATALESAQPRMEFPDSEIGRDDLAG